MKVKNISPAGDLEVPAIGAIVLAGESVEVSAVLGALLLEQSSNWAPVKEKSE